MKYHRHSHHVAIGNRQSFHLTADDFGVIRRVGHHSSQHLGQDKLMNEIGRGLNVVFIGFLGHWQRIEGGIYRVSRSCHGENVTVVSGMYKCKNLDDDCNLGKIYWMNHADARNHTKNNK